MHKQVGYNEATTTANNVVATLPIAATAGNLLIAVHRYSTAIANHVVPSGFTARVSSTRTDFTTITISSKTAVGGETTFTARTDALTNMLVLQELLVIEVDGINGAFDIAGTSNAGTIATLTTTTSALASGNKLVLSAVATTTNSTAFGSLSGYTKLIAEPTTNGRLTVSAKDDGDTSTESTVQTWTTTAGAAGILASFTYTPNQVTPPKVTGSASFSVQSSLTANGTKRGPFYQRFSSGLKIKVGTPLVQNPTKLDSPMFASQLGATIANTAFTSNITQPSWDMVSNYYRAVHWEGHGWSKVIDSDASSGPVKFVANRASTHGGYVYVNGSYVTQGSPWTPVSFAAHVEREFPLGISTLDTETGMILSNAITTTATTLTIVLPTTKPTLPAFHTAGTPSTFWPMIGSTIAPTKDNTFSRNTANYVSWVRIRDEIIGLPPYSAGNWSISAGVATITGVIRGMWQTVPAGHTQNTKVRTPVYIGSSSASPTDDGLTGNPWANSSGSPLRYGLNFWDAARGTRHDGVRAICDLASMELQGWSMTSLLKTVTNVTTTPGVITVANHGYTNGSRVAFGGYDIPGGVRAMLPYWVVGATTNTFQIANTENGTPITFTSTNANSFKVAKLSRLPSNPVSLGIWWDVTSTAPYNNADPYGNDMKNSSAIIDLPYDFTNSTNSTLWSIRQAEKRAKLATKLTTLGFPTFRMIANNYLSQPSQVAVGERMTAMADNPGNYDGFPLEHFGQEPASINGQIDQLCQVMRGVDGSNVVKNPNGNLALQWVKTYDWKDVSPFRATAGMYLVDGSNVYKYGQDRYIRFNYALWLLTWRESATNPIHLTKAFNTKITERPSDQAGRELYFWDFGVPTTQLGGKPTNPNSRTDLHSPATGIYTRKYTNGLVIVNNTSSDYVYTADRQYYNAMSEVNRSGVLSLVTSGSNVTIEAYGGGFLLNG